MKRKMPLGEDTLPIADIDGNLLRHSDLVGKGIALSMALASISDRLLIERVRQRISQGRVGPIYQVPQKEYSPSDQLQHMIDKDELGKLLLDAERKLLEEEIRIIEGRIK